MGKQWKVEKRREGKEFRRELKTPDLSSGEADRSISPDKAVTTEVMTWNNSIFSTARRAGDQWDRPFLSNRRDLVKPVYEPPSSQQDSPNAAPTPSSYKVPVIWAPKSLEKAKNSSYGVVAAISTKDKLQQPMTILLTLHPAIGPQRWCKWLWRQWVVRELTMA